MMSKEKARKALMRLGECRIVVLAISYVFLKIFFMLFKCIIKMSRFKFGQIDVASNYFHKERQISDIFMINLNKAVVFYEVSCNNRKDWQHIVSHKEDEETTIALFINTPRNIFSHGVSQYDKNSAYTMSFEPKQNLDHL